MTLRGGLLPYAAGFVAMLAAGVVLVVATLGSLDSTRLLWVSSGLSVLAIVSAAAAVLRPRR